MINADNVCGKLREKSRETRNIGKRRKRAIYVDNCNIFGGKRVQYNLRRIKKKMRRREDGKRRVLFKW